VSSIDVDRSAIRYRSRRPDDGASRARLRELATSRRRFGYAVCTSCSEASDLDSTARPVIECAASPSTERFGMAEKIVWERQLLRNIGFAFDVKKSQLIRITSQTIIDFVVFNRKNLRERFDQARTKANQRKVFITTGDELVSKLNNTMMTIVEDTFEGNHDLQEGMCSRKRYELAAKRGLWTAHYDRPLTEMPTHGCTENLTEALAPYGIPIEDIPSPFNIFQDMIIHQDTGILEFSKLRPKPPGAHVTLRAEMDLLAALSTCPDPFIGGNTGTTLTVLE
jgi:uncharacterized protein YcgI (DUF1989 family)